ISRGAAARSGPEVEAPVAQMVGGRALARHAQRMVQRQKLYGRAHAEAARPGHDPARDQQGRRQDRARGVDQHLGQPHDVEPPLLTGVGEIEQLLEPLALTAPAPYLLREDPEVHALSLRRPEAIAAAGTAGLPKRYCSGADRAVKAPVRQHSPFLT